MTDVQKCHVMSWIHVHLASCAVTMPHGVAVVPHHDVTWCQLSHDVTWCHMMSHDSRLTNKDIDDDECNEDVIGYEPQNGRQCFPTVSSLMCAIRLLNLR